MNVENCTFCGDFFSIKPDANYEYGMVIHKNKLHIVKEDIKIISSVSKFEINYCTFCGRKIYEI